MRLKILLLFGLFIFCETNIQAQLIDTLPWCPPGATWVYSQTNRFYKITYLKDTLINGENSKSFVVEEAIRDLSTGNFNSEYQIVRTDLILKEKNDSIFYYWDKLESENEWVFIYDFIASEGDIYYTDNEYFSNDCINEDSSLISYDTILVNLSQRILINRNSLESPSLSPFRYPSVLPYIGAI